MNFVYDAGVLIAAERSERRTWAEHRARLELGIVPITTAPVVAPVSRSICRVQLRRFLAGCTVMPFAAGQAHQVGELLAAAGSVDIVDAHVIVVAAATVATVLSSDPDDLKRLAEALDVHVPILAI